MLRIVFTVVIASFVLAGRASADFMDMPAIGALDRLPPSAASASLVDLQRESGYLEVGYYAVDAGASSLQRARPVDAGLTDSAAASRLPWPGVWLDPKWAPLSLAAFLLALAGYAIRRTARSAGRA
jgi:hypothetical protein